MVDILYIELGIEKYVLLRIPSAAKCFGARLYHSAGKIRWERIRQTGLFLSFSTHSCPCRLESLFRRQVFFPRSEKIF